MRAILVLAALVLAVSACGKKAPLRAPGEPQEETSAG
ncbi:LPS translocon maturation chaperone LptM [Hyphococcus flavus]